MMTSARTPIDAALRLVVAIFVVLMATPAPLAAEPNARVRPVVLRTTAAIATENDGPVTVSLESTATAVRAGSPFAFDVSIASSETLPYVETRFRLKRPTGRLIFQRTRVENGLSANAPVRYTFERDTADLGLATGAYPIEVTTRYSLGDQVSEVTLAGAMLVYDEATRRLPVVIVARVSGQPLAGPSGRFVVDPDRYSGARDNVEAVSRLVLDDDKVRLTLAVSPLLLEEWRRISEGFEIAGPEGIETVPPTSRVSEDFSRALDTLRQAMDTGRLELLSLGYSDPDPTDLAANGLGDDVVTQYRVGYSAIRASTESTASTGTAPAGGCLPPQLVDELASTEVSYAVLSARCARSGEQTATTGAYRVGKSRLVALVADDATAAAIEDGDERAVIERAFSRYAENTAHPLVIALELDAGSADAAALGNSLRTVAQQPWMQLSLGREQGPRAKGRVSLSASEAGSQAPNNYWGDVAQARLWSDALAAALPKGDTRAQTARADAFIAQSSAWEGRNGEWALAERGRSFSTESLALSRQVLERVALTVKPVTLAGNKGEVPASITNGTDLTLNLRLRVNPSSGIAASAPNDGDLELRPQENVVMIPVDVGNSLSGRINVQVVAGDLVLAQQTVTVGASILDKIAIIGGIVLVLGVLLAYIVRRVRAAEPIDRHSQYTESDGRSVR